jgi:AcrR family transcriptional regulator
VSPRPYRMVQRQAAADENRERILAAARSLLLAEDFSEFTMEAVARKADVSRLTIYYQFSSKTGLLEELYNYIARRGEMGYLADVFRRDVDPLRTLHDFVRVFAKFWASDRDVIRRLHGLGAIDSEIGEGLRARNERRRNGVRVIVERYFRMYPPLTSLQQPIAVDTLHMITSFETFDTLAVPGRSVEEVIAIIRKMADQAIGFTPRTI